MSPVLCLHLVSPDTLHTPIPWVARRPVGHRVCGFAILSIAGKWGGGGREAQKGVPPAQSHTAQRSGASHSSQCIQVSGTRFTHSIRKMFIELLLCTGAGAGASVGTTWSSLLPSRRPPGAGVHAPSTGALRLLFPLLGTLFPQITAWLSLLPSSVEGPRGPCPPGPAPRSCAGPPPADLAPSPSSSLPSKASEDTGGPGRPQPDLGDLACWP